MIDVRQHVVAVMRVRGLEAERLAYENSIVDHLNATHPDTDPIRGAQCRNLLPIGTGPHAWLHNDCWEAWREDRRVKAVAALAEAGVP